MHQIFHARKASLALYVLNFKPFWWVVISCYARIQDIEVGLRMHLLVLCKGKVLNKILLII